MPNVILEGMARGLAVLATDVGAVELIVDKTNGIIIQPLNQRGLEDAIKEFSMMNSEDLDRMKYKSLEKVKNQYLWTRLASATLKRISAALED
jgi:glycosyltransferase involved in cell wall biosynthesis